jgi:hypothetical protein
MARQELLLENHMLATLFIMCFVFNLMFGLMMQLYSCNPSEMFQVKLYNLLM